MRDRKPGQPESLGSRPRILRVDPDTCTTEQLAPAVRWMHDGGIVIYPTETFYGIAVDPTLPAAVDAVFDLKGRDASVAIPLVAASRDIVGLNFPLDSRSEALARRFWPGPLSLILDAPTWIAPAVHGGTKTVAVRVPAHPIARLLAALSARGVVTATSANRSGSPPAADAASLDDCRDDPRVFVIDGGPTTGGAPSTIVDARRLPLTLVREGAVPWSRVVDSI